GGHAFAVEVVDALEDALLAVVDGRRGNDADHSDIGLLFENAGGGSGGVAIDGACGRVFGFGGDMSEAQGVAVDGGVVSGDVLQPDGVVRRDFVEVGGVDVAVFGELALVPAGAQDPFAGFSDGDAGLNAADDFGDAFGVRQLDVVKLVDAAILKVAVGVDEAGGGGSAVEIENL